MTVTPTPQSSPYEFVGEIPGLGSLELKQLAQSYAELDTTSLEEFFPTQNIIPRTITIETVKTSLGLMRMVDMGQVDAASMANDRIERRTVEPAVFRESDFFDIGFINQIREYGTLNEATPADEMIQRRIRKLVDKRNRTIDYFRTQVLLGGIDYTDPITKAVCKVSTQIPQHNFFHYNGYNDTKTPGASIGVNGYTAYDNLENNKNRPEALFFKTVDDKIGAPWTEPKSDILHTLKYIQNWLRNTNKNVYTDIVMSHDLKTVLMENQLIKSYSGQYGVFNWELGSTRGQNIPTVGGTTPMVTFGPGGDLVSIGGLNIITVDNMFLNPRTNKHEKMWPNNVVAIVARRHFRDTQETIGQTVHPVAEGPNQQPGMWMWSSDVEYDPPNPPGRAVQIGDSFLPYATYPQWICILTVAEEEDVYSNTLLRSDLDYGFAF